MPPATSAQPTATRPSVAAPPATHAAAPSHAPRLKPTPPAPKLVSVFQRVPNPSGAV
jgi:hypothetical protein